jgi:hypothetical protein
VLGLVTNLGPIKSAIPWNATDGVRHMALDPSVSEPLTYRASSDERTIQLPPLGNPFREILLAAELTWSIARCMSLLIFDDERDKHFWLL